MLDLLWSAFGFVIAISVLVCFHEFGHYWMARRLGVKVLRFSLGWGKPLRSHLSRDGVEWSIAPWPIGGYVKLLDEREGPVPPSMRHMAFNNQSVGRRMAILAAGPAFNFLLAILLYWGTLVVGVPGMKPVLAPPPAQSAAAQAGLQGGEEVTALDGRPVPTWSVLSTDLIDESLKARSLLLQVRSADGHERVVTIDLSQVRVDPEYLFEDLGLRPFRPSIPPVVAEVAPGSAAEAAGFQAGDRLLSRDGQPISDWQAWADWVGANPGAVAQVEVERSGARRKLEVVIGAVEGQPTRGLFGATAHVPPELWQHLRAEWQLDPVSALPAAARQTWQMSALTLRMLWKMVVGELSLKNISGPIQIAQVAGISVQSGLVSFLTFMAVISISLGVLNLLPVPMLDGGHLLLYAIEGLRGRPLSERVQAASQYIGFAFIGLLMLLAFYNDIMRFV